MNISRYKAAIFDLDGTLADSMGVWDTVCRDWLTMRGYSVPDSLEDTISIMTLQQSSVYISQNFTTKEAPAKIVEEWNELVCRRYETDVKPKPGAVQLVKSLSEKMPLAIATSGFKEACEGFLAANDIRGCFSAVVYSDEVNADKTHPDIYLACAERLGVAAQDCIVFEDLPAAADGVRAAGMGLVAVYDASSSGNWNSFSAEADIAMVSFQ